MLDFLKEDWALFTKEVDGALNYLMQPVSLTGKQDLMLKPTNEEIAEKRNDSSFWKSEWKMFEKEVDSLLDFLTHPIKID